MIKFTCGSLRRMVKKVLYLLAGGESAFCLFSCISAIVTDFTRIKVCATGGADFEIRHLGPPFILAYDDRLADQEPAPGELGACSEPTMHLNRILEKTPCNQVRVVYRSVVLLYILRRV